MREPHICGYNGNQVPPTRLGIPGNAGWTTSKWRWRDEERHCRRWRVQGCSWTGRVGETSSLTDPRPISTAVEGTTEPRQNIMAYHAYASAAMTIQHQMCDNDRQQAYKAKALGVPLHVAFARWSPTPPCLHIDTAQIRILKRYVAVAYYWNGTIPQSSVLTHGGECQYHRQVTRYKGQTFTQSLIRQPQPINHIRLRYSLADVDKKRKSLSLVNRLYITVCSEVLL